MNLRSFFAILISLTFSAILVLSFQNCGVTKGSEDQPSMMRQFSIAPGQFANYIQYSGENCGATSIPRCLTVVQGKIHFLGLPYKNAALTICHKRPTDLDYKAGGCIHIETDQDGDIIRSGEVGTKGFEIATCIDTTRIDISIFMDFIPLDNAEYTIYRKPILSNFSLPTCYQEN